MSLFKQDTENVSWKQRPGSQPVSPCLWGQTNPQLHQELQESCSIPSGHSTSGFKIHIFGKIHISGKGILLYQSTPGHFSPGPSWQSTPVTTAVTELTIQGTTVPQLHFKFETESPKVKVKIRDFCCNDLIVCLS